MDKIRFATLIMFIAARTGKEFSTHEIEDLHTLVTPPPSTNSDRPIVPEAVVCELLAAMKDQRKIDAIKAYRTLTNVGLKEAKDAVERYYYPPMLAG